MSQLEVKETVRTINPSNKLSLGVTTLPSRPLVFAGNGLAEPRRLTQFPVRSTKQSRAVKAKRQAQARSGFKSQPRVIIP